ncbi:MAG: CBS domain-containing protein, partial [Duodenibacillus sp.]|nr:CBS domain-containing protein [Duodenibacillus sp.]
ALGDAIAGACMVARNFSAEDFARSHPAGALGRRLLLTVGDVMRKGEAVPAVAPDTPALDALQVLSAKRLGSFVVVDGDNRPVGIFTEGDLCRRLREGGDFLAARAADVMHLNPKSVGADEPAYAGLNKMHALQVNQLVVTGADGRLAGIVHIQDMVARKIVA